MVESEYCEICGATETVQHQLYECQNADKQREFAKSINPKLELNGLYSLIEIGTDPKIELLKTVIIRNLIQIDRSKDISFEKFNGIYEWYCNICNIK